MRPEDGLIPLPYMARQADGWAWEDATSVPLGPATTSRQTFYPDASRIYEEIDRLGSGSDGRPVELSSVADFDFVRAAPPGAWKKGASRPTGRTSEPATFRPSGWASTSTAISRSTCTANRR